MRVVWALPQQLPTSAKANSVELLFTQNKTLPLPLWVKQSANADSLHKEVRRDLLYCKIYQRGRVSRVADTEHILTIVDLIDRRLS